MDTEVAERINRTEGLQWIIENATEEIDEIRIDRYDAEAGGIGRLQIYYRLEYYK